MPPSPLPRTGRWKTLLRSTPSTVEVAERGPARKLVGSQERGVDHSRRLAHTLVDEIVERHAADPLGDQRQHDETAVAVRELLACGELGRVAVEHREVLLRRGQLGEPGPASRSRLMS